MNDHLIVTIQYIRGSFVTGLLNGHDHQEISDRQQISARLALADRDLLTIGIYYSSRACLCTYQTRQSEMADLARRATRWVGTIPYILTPIPNLYDHSFPRYGQITFLTFRRPTTLTVDLKF